MVNGATVTTSTFKLDLEETVVHYIPVDASFEGEAIRDGTRRIHCTPRAAN